MKAAGPRFGARCKEAGLPMRSSSSACFAAASLVALGMLLSACVETSESPAQGVNQPQDLTDADPESANKEVAEGANAKARAHTLRPVIERHAQENNIPVALANAVIRIESNYNARIVHAGNYGLMQIKLATARSLGFAGSAAALLDPDTNLHFGLKYLAGVYHEADGDVCRAVMKYQSGHLAFRMSPANRIYCRRVKSLMAS